MENHTATLPAAAAAEPQAELASRYGAGLRRRYLLLSGLALLIIILALQAVAVGAYDLSPLKVLTILLGQGEGARAVVVFNIRLPRIAAAVVTGWGLGIAGLVTQSLLRNPLASPFTLGMSHGAAFGAAFAIVFLGAGAVGTSALYSAGSGEFMFSSLYAVTIMAFAGAMAATGVILLLARLRRMSASAVILAGVAMSSLFMSGTILIQYFATEVEIATVVFWTFGDVARSNWREIAILSAATALVSLYFLRRRWDLNALLAGEETAQGLGVRVARLRLAGMFLASLVVALATAFHGIIAFLGLLAPHISRRLVGGDHRLLVPCSGLVGAVLLLAADTLGRLVVGSGSLPVGVLTSFMGAPLFLYLLLRERQA
jgi:iron complex transport system permease protein